MQQNKGKRNKIHTDAMQNLYKKVVTKTPQKKRKKLEDIKKLKSLIDQANLVKNQPPLTIDEIAASGEMSYPLALKISDFLLTKPKDILHFIFGNNEARESEKEDAFQYWVNNDGEAIDKLVDLKVGNEIENDEFEELYNSDIETISEFLVSEGYYGDEYSYSKQMEKEDLRESDQPESENYYFLRKVFAWFQAFERLHRVRDFLISLINLAKEKEQFMKRGKMDTFPAQKQRHEIAKFIQDKINFQKLNENVFASTLSIDEDGCIHFSISEWAEALQGVDITRIRTCEVCESIFWADRKDAYACSKKHAKVRQMRLLRKNWKEKGAQYLEARQNKIKKKRELKSNGSL